MKSITLKIEGMHCEGCTATVKELLTREPGVKAASVSLEGREARVLFDPAAVGEDRLVAVVERPGYRVIGREASAREG